MRVFVTGATGFIGSAVVRELLGSGHRVTGLARSDKAAAAVAAAGAEVFRGSLEDTGGLAAAAAAADGVIHTGYIHDFSPAANPAAAAAVDGAAIAAFGEALAGTGRPLVVASGLPAPEPGQVVTEELAASDNPHWPRVSERAAMPLADAERASLGGPAAAVGARRGRLRLRPGAASASPGPRACPPTSATARNVWPAVHRLDAARLFRIALEEAPAGTLLNAIGDEGVPFRDIAETIGRHLDVPVKSVTAEEAREHFGTFAVFAAFDVPASSARTRQRFGWRPARARADRGSRPGALLHRSG